MSDIHSVFNDEDEGDHWVSVADMMAGLMVIFLFIAISYILFGLDEIKQDEFVQSEYITQIETLQKQKEQLEVRLQNATHDISQHYEQKLEEWKEQIEKIIKAQEVDEAIYLALKNEFKDDLLNWDAELTRDLTIRFKSPDILFDTGEATLKPKFEEILSDFIPRYLRVLEPFEISIEELRIEGHTSSKWDEVETEIDAYFKNMELSQSRTRVVLEYSLDEIGAWNKHEWARSLLTANGLSSSRLIKQNGEENPLLSRRVEFKIRTKVKQEILKALDRLQ